MILSLLMLLALWGIGLMAALMYVEDEELSERGRWRRDNPLPHGYDGLGGELDALEDKFEGNALAVRKAYYLKSHVRHDEVVQKALSKQPEKLARYLQYKREKEARDHQEDD